ncbi:hypothetical protein BTJ68_04556 [Hortaea werneckii EXF-2000]|uniref:Major facilitator superfamily (MFS) profile domain-containing protein n=1 Tax=Hortaea werneckii EXF-2000 TaxID=1157616 RepID=A0A1Z5TJV1_HORWE|nr:hypothetical protein BTJ68_04556 [Hortaea werneckii EXF-2000]
MSNPGSTAPGADPSRTPSAWTAKSEKDNETPEGVTPDTRSEVEKNEASAARLGRVIGGKYLKKDENEESPASAQHQDHGPLTEVDADIPLTLTEVVNKNGQEYIFIDFADGDQENPFNWNPWYKRFITTILNLMTLFIGLATTAYSSGISSMNKDLNASHTEGQLGLFTFNMTCAVAPMILAPFCELVGRKIVYAGAYLCFSLCFIGLALGQNISTIIVMRCLLGLFGCVGTILVGGTFDDMYQPRERGGPMAMFSFIAIFGTVAAPIYAGFIDQSIGWRWIEGIQGLSNIPLLLVVFIFFPETRGGVYLHKRAKALRKATGDQRYVAAEDINTPTLKSMLKASSVKAVKMLSTEPVVFAFGFWIAFCWGVVFLFLSVIPITFSEKRGWSEGVSGLPYISLCIGTTLGWLANYLQMGKYEKIVQNPDRKVVPEDRLYGAMLGAPLLPIGLFIYSFTQYAFLIWVGPVIALAPIAFGIYFVFESTYSYTADCYDKQQMDPQSSVPPGGLARPRDRRRSGFFSDPRNRIEFAYDDEALIQRLYRSAWLNGKTYGKDYEFPAWLNETPDVIGDPSRISEFRLDVLRDDDKAAANYNEARYVRNRAFIRHIYEAVKTQNQHVGEHNTTSAQPLGATNVTTSQVTTHNAEVGFKYVRLYAPHEALKLYPMGVTKEGINMENTSQVDISENVACLLGRNGDANVRREIDRKFPKFKEAQYQEVILNPGDCLLNILVRNKAKLITQFPDLESNKAFKLTIFEGNPDDGTSLEDCLKGAEVVHMCIATNESKPGLSLAQDTTKAIISALEQLRKEAGAGYTKPTILMLRSAGINEKFRSGREWGKLVGHFVLHYVYTDLQLACDLLSSKVQEAPGLFDYIIVDPPSLHNADAGGLHFRKKW